jgi:uncharacterized protein (TIGR03435 family)
MMPKFLKVPETQTNNQIDEPKSDAQDVAAPDGTGHAFEVAAIRPTDLNAGREHQFMGAQLAPSGRFTVSDFTLNNLVSIAYLGDERHTMILGGPKWVDSERFDINAKVEEADMAGWDKLSDAQRMGRVRPLLRTLLEQRFRLKLHTEMRVTPVFALVLVKGGAKLKAVAPPPPIDPQALEAMKRGDFPAKGLPGAFMMMDDTWTCNACPVSAIGDEVAANSGDDVSVVIDQTGLTGYYDFTFKPSHKKDGPTLRDQIEDQFGLKLEPRKMPIKTYVIDSAEKPSVDGAEVQEPPALAPVSFASQPPAPAVQGSPANPAAPFPAFDVATVKPNDPSRHPGATAWSQGPTEDELKMMGSLKTFLKYAYGIEDVQIAGGPKWLDNDLFEIDAKASSPASAAQMRLMLRALLEQRFKLSTHTETKPVAVYSLVVAKGGPKIQQADTSGPGASSSGSTLIRGTLDTGQLAQMLTRVLGRSVIDNTGLNGAYNVGLTWAADDDPSGPSLFTAVQEQLGLKLEPTKGPVETLVIDHAERPSEN